MQNEITQLFKIKYPIISGGMVWVSGGKLAAAVSNAGGLGLIGAGSMAPELLKQHILKAQELTTQPIGINIPLLYDKVEDQIKTALSNNIKIFFTSAGSPKKWTSYLKDQGAIVVHVTSSPELAIKCEEAGVDAVVAEGFEAGGHNGRDEITTLALIPQVVKAVKIPVIAAGGIATGEAILAMMCLGAKGVQMGTRFLMTQESSAHTEFKNYALNAQANSTKLLMKKTVPVRLLQNNFSKQVEVLENKFINEELILKLNEHLGKGRARDGMLHGNISEGELEVGQIISLIKDVPTCDQLLKQLINEYQMAFKKLQSLQF